MKVILNQEVIDFLNCFSKSVTSEGTTVYTIDCTVKDNQDGTFNIIDNSLGRLFKPTTNNMSGSIKFEGTQEEWEALVKKNKIAFIAQACHEANRVWCMSQGDYSQSHWLEAAEWQRESAIKGVEFRLANPGANPGAQHDAWVADKISNGWVYGVVKDTEKKTHPSLIPFDQLSVFEKKKDALFCAIVDALV